MDEIFKEFDKTPLASASIAQVIVHPHSRYLTYIGP